MVTLLPLEVTDLSVVAPVVAVLVVRLLVGAGAAMGCSVSAALLRVNWMLLVLTVLASLPLLARGAAVILLLMGPAV